jgi:putative Ca2+/H+ antiporter (TMEM165/GDT1 family)
MFAFGQALLFITLAEMGDKTQLVSLAFAARFQARLVLAAILVATLLVHLFSVAIGEVLGLVIPTFWLSVAAALAFIGFGLWTLRGDSLQSDQHATEGRYGPFLLVAGTFFIAELGDKTMLATVTLASQLHAFVPVWLGSSMGMVIADGIAIVVGAVAGKRLPERTIRLAAAAIFVLSGLLTLGSATLNWTIS